MRLVAPRNFIVLSAITFAALAISARAQQPSDADDKYIWLEDVSSARSMAWVKAENERTAKVLEGDPRYAAYDADALKIASDPSRLPMPEIVGNDIYNFWRDAKNPHGLFRKTTLADYLTDKPTWRPVLDIDELGKKDKQSWVSHGNNCLYPGDHYCLQNLSAGGEDADTVREFDLKLEKFVDGGFVLPHSKQNVAWKDKDTLFVAREWGPGAMTTSGYPFIVKEWRRGTPLESAKEVFRGKETDQVGTFAFHVDDAQGDSLNLIGEGVTFFGFKYLVETPSGFKTLAVPAKSSPGSLISGRLLLNISEDWTPEGQTKHFKAGSLLELDLKALLADPAHLKPRVVFEPTAKEFFEGSATTKDRLIVTTLNHVQGGAYIYTPSGSGWTKKQLPVPENVAVGISSASNTDNKFFLTITGFLTPTSLYLGDAGTGSLTLEKTQPALFDASKDVVEQLEATSKDGTKVPYFVVHPKSVVYDGSNPTLLNAYGGFEISETPRYSATGGKLWLERGGVFVLANIRGGGEFGPAWHEAGLKTKRQVIYDDFAAVGRDLIARKITSTPHLGILGGSNGGLLMGVEMTQHPDLWHAVVIQVPLLDMLRFEKIAAGASWVGEYGSVSIPDERKFLEGISPYNQLKPDVKYPEPLIFTTTKDDRVGPQHARKFAAKMEEYNKPFLYDEIIEGGHGAGADLKEEARTSAETYIYLTQKLMDAPK
jgi:prolyl oligopeptidase